MAQRNSLHLGRSLNDAMTTALKSSLRRLLSRCGLRLIKSTHPGARYVDHVPGSPLDYLILSQFPELRGRSFLQIGAHDGVRNDPLYRWIGNHDWTGTLVEPMPDFARQLRTLYAGRPQINVLECAIAAHAGSTVLYRIDPQLQELPDWAAGVATLDRNRALEATRALGLEPRHRVSQPVQTITMPELLRRFPPPGPAIVAIDTEGHDILLATALLDAGCRPTLLHFEHACAPAADWWTLLRYLHDLGYDSVTHGADTTAYRHK